MCKVFYEDGGGKIMAIGGLCGAKIGLKKVMIKGGNYLCYDCVKAAGFYPLTWTGNMKTSLSEIQIRINGSNDTTNTTEMTVTQSIGNIFMVDEQNHLWRTQDQFGLHKSTIHRFEDIIDYELLEDGDLQTKGGLGSALAGGLTFGAAGAIVGASVGKKKTTSNCSSISIKITLKSMNAPVENVNLLQMKVSKTSAAYKKAFAQAQEILSLLKIMTSSAKKHEVFETAASAADEILKFKNLLDAGIITQEEFEKKKQQLLG